MEKVQFFTFGQSNVRVVREGVEVRFVGVDVAKALGYRNPQRAVRTHCKFATGMDAPAKGGESELTIRECDVYRLSIHSKLPAADEFEAWVADEVLPEIRGRGTYAMDLKVKDMLADPDTMIQALVALKDERSRRIKAERDRHKISSQREATAMAMASKYKRQAAKLKEDADYLASLLDSSSLVTTTIIAKQLGTSAVLLNRFLKGRGVQYRLSDAWVIRAKYQRKGLGRYVTHQVGRSNGAETVKHWKWTEKGMRFIHDLWEKHKGES